MSCKPKRFRAALLFLLVAPAVHSFSQTSKQKLQTTNAALFDKAAARHKQELRDLQETRAIRPVSLPNVTAKTLTATLAAKPRAGLAGYLAGTAVLFYSYDEAALNIWLVDAGGIRAYQREEISQEQISKIIANLRTSLGVDSLQRSRVPRKRDLPLPTEGAGEKVPQDQAVAAATDLFVPDPIAKVLTNVNHLIVVPVLGIGTVPFAVLKPFGANSYLIDDMSISIAPSLYDMGHGIDHWKPKFSNPLVVGNPFVPPSDNWIIPPLPGAESEAKEIAKLINATPLIDKDATKETVELRLAESDFLYFASHGVASAADPLSGFLLLSGPSIEEGELTAREVQVTNLSAQLVVLSACQTGLGQVHDAGIIGLARAFEIAGAPRVVMSLWSVNDEATNELMQAFVKDLQTDIPSEALRKAMIETRKTRPNPSEWASFVLFGTPR